MEQEIWIPFLSNNYSISNFGNIRSEEKFVRTHAPYLKKQKIMRHFDNGHGYRYFTAMVNNVRRNYYIHILVAKNFIENPFNKPEVNHKDGNKCNNHFKNLEWVTKSENLIHAHETGLMPSGGDKYNAIKLINIKTLIVFDCIKHAAYFYKIKYGLLKDVLNRGKNRNHKVEIYSQLKPFVKWCEENPEEAKKLNLSENRLK